MGQRFQTVFILPSVYMNEGNLNNRNKKVLVYHNQWLYGYSALIINMNILKRLQRYIKNIKNLDYGDKRTFINHYLEDTIKSDVVLYSTLKEFPSKREFHLSKEFEFKDFKQLGQELSKQDNNNGFFICEITENLKLKYAFISGLEDEDEHKIKLPEQYLNLFYKEEQLKEFDKQLLKEINKTIEQYKQFEGMLLYDVKDIITELNKKILRG